MNFTQEELALENVSANWFRNGLIAFVSFITLFTVSRNLDINYKTIGIAVLIITAIIFAITAQSGQRLNYKKYDGFLYFAYKYFSYVMLFFVIILIYIVYVSH
ncbi:putative orfan [Tupanvirus soda lake]|uniref:Orfan n=2 Tax=Tupanvirus TaxID=2094720 RepID=A0AC62AD89_9VIRU|nr:putative orfan [Tupanvirus soda lake]QKU35704.1 putative orfan [Tupanvirus soda lake]